MVNGAGEFASTRLSMDFVWLNEKGQWTYKNQDDENRYFKPDLIVTKSIVHALIWSEPNSASLITLDKLVRKSGSDTLIGYKKHVIFAVKKVGQKLGFTHMPPSIQHEKLNLVGSMVLLQKVQFRNAVDKHSVTLR